MSNASKQYTLCLKSSISTVVCMASLFLGITGAQAFTVKYTDSGNAIQWHDEIVPYYVDPTLSYLDAASVKSAVVGGFDVWNNVQGARLNLQYSGTAIGEREGANPTGDNRNVVRFEEAAFPYDDTVLAITLLTYDSRSGEILDGDIVVNAEVHRFSAGQDQQSDSHDIQNTIAHEAGHLIGLGHDADVEESTMYPVARPGETNKRSLSSDDEDGVNYLYPGPEVSTTNGPTPAPSGIPGQPDLPERTAMAQNREVTLERVQLNLHCSQSAIGSGDTFPLFPIVMLAALARLGARRRNRGTI